MTRISVLNSKKLQSVDESKKINLDVDKVYTIEYGANKATVKFDGSIYEATATNGDKKATFKADVSPEYTLSAAFSKVGFKIQASAIHADLVRQFRSR